LIVHVFHLKKQKETQSLEPVPTNLIKLSQVDLSTKLSQQNR